MSQLDHPPQFGDLPREVRQQIFEACLPRRVWRFTYEQLGDTPVKPVRAVSEKPSRLPEIAFVCKEAHYIAIRYMQEWMVDFTRVWNQSQDYRYTTTKILFNPYLDMLLLNYTGPTADEDPANGHIEHDNYLENLPRGPYALAVAPDTNIVLEMSLLVGPRRTGTPPWIKWLSTRPYSDCLAQQKDYRVKLATTSFVMSREEIKSCGLFGLLGDERHILIDIGDTAKIDLYQAYLEDLELRTDRQRSSKWTHFDNAPDESDDTMLITGENSTSMGASRYGAHGIARYGPSIAEWDAARALRLIRQVWLEANDCFEPANMPRIPWTGDELHRHWDLDHHLSQHYINQLPQLSFVVMFMVSEE